jgi:hypothetical protein
VSCQPAVSREADDDDDDDDESDDEYDDEDLSQKPVSTFGFPNRLAQGLARCVLADSRRDFGSTGKDRHAAVVIRYLDPSAALRSTPSPAEAPRSSSTPDPGGSPREDLVDADEDGEEVGAASAQGKRARGPRGPFRRACSRPRGCFGAWIPKQDVSTSEVRHRVWSKRDSRFHYALQDQDPSSTHFE